MDKLIHPNYTEEMNWYPNKPYELKHVYDAEKDEYVINELQCCYYSPVSKHKYCTHKNDCIFNNERWEYYDERLQPIVSEIKNIRRLIEEYENIKQHLINNEIIYHPNFDQHYIIKKNKTYGSDGKVKYNIEIEVDDNFKNIISREENNLKMELRQLNRELLRLKRRR